MIKAVFFDFYGTLAQFHPPREDIQAGACASFGFKPTREGLVRGYVMADDLMSQVNASETRMSQLVGQGRVRFFAEYERLILRGAGIAVDLETAERVWEKVQEIPHGLALFDDALPVLDMLKQRELTIGMLSNIGRDAQELSDELGLSPYLDFAVTSQEVEASKPHPPMFLMALQRAEVEPEEALHVGDSVLSDVQGARGVGINPLLLDREGVMDNVNDCPKIDSLLGVLEYL
jgi:HAD superfamily hydrolase (TIGR01549 family)